MARPCVQEDFGCKFGMTTCHKHEIQTGAGFHDYFLEIVRMQVLPLTFFVFQNECVALFIYFLDFLVAHKREILEVFIFFFYLLSSHSVPRKVNSTWFCLQNFDEFFQGPMYLVNLNLFLCLL